MCVPTYLAALNGKLDVPGCHVVNELQQPVSGVNAVDAVKEQETCLLVGRVEDLPVLVIEGKAQDSQNVLTVDEATKEGVCLLHNRQLNALESGSSPFPILSPHIEVCVCVLVQ